MNSKEALKEICINCRNNINQIPSKGDRPYKECPYRGISNDYCEEYEIIKKDLEILECFRKIPKQDLKDFIEWQIRYEKNMKTWLEERHFCYIGKEEEYTKHLIKIKEWLENGND